MGLCIAWERAGGRAGNHRGAILIAALHIEGDFDVAVDFVGSCYMVIRTWSVENLLPSSFVLNRQIQQTVALGDSAISSSQASSN